jgi:hypothetical protein
MENIIIIQHEPLTARTQKIFCINELLNVGFNVEYWDMSQYFFPGLSFVNEIKETYCLEINSLEKLQEKLKTKAVKETVFIIEVADNWKNRKFFKLVKQSGYYTIKMDFYGTSCISSNYINRFIRETIRGKIQMIVSLLNRLLYKVYHKYYRFHSFDVEMSSNPSLKYPKSILINHPDYEQSRANSNHSLINNNYAVFLDQYFPLHPDIKYNRKLNFNEKDSQNYLELMKTFFEKIEQQFNVQVVIAAHPKSKYTESDFGNRIVMKSQTSQLVQYAQFVILHGSTSISYAAIFYRPLLGCFTNDYKKRAAYFYDFAFRQNKYFNAPFVHIEKSIGSELPVPYIDKSVCTQYKYTYLTRPEIESMENNNIFVHNFKRVFAYAS